MDSFIAFFFTSFLAVVAVAVAGVPVPYKFVTDAQNMERLKASYGVAHKAEVVEEYEPPCSDSHPNCKGNTPNPNCCTHFSNAITTTSTSCNGDVIMSWVFVLIFASVVAGLFAL